VLLKGAGRPLFCARSLIVCRAGIKSLQVNACVAGGRGKTKNDYVADSRAFVVTERLVVR